MKIVEIAAPGLWQIESIKEIHARAERLMSIPEGMFVHPTANTSGEVRAARKWAYEYVNLCYYRRDLLNVLAARSRQTAADR